MSIVRGWTESLLNNIGREKTNTSGETVGMGQLKWEGGCGNETFSFLILGVTALTIVGERDKGPSQ